MNQKSLLVLEKRILDACRNGEVDLPSLPDIALKIKEAVNDPNKDLNQIAKLLEMDPNIAASVIKLANSSVFSGYCSSSSCRDAVARLGIHVIKDIVVCIAVNNLFSAPNPQLKYRLSKILDKSRRVGAISYVIASIVKGKLAEKAMLAGLISKIGALPIISYLSRFPEINDRPDIVERIVNKMSGYVGTIILEQWNFDKDLISVPENLDNWFRDENPEPDYADIIIVANIHSMYGHSNPGIKIPPLIEIPAFKKLGISKLGPQASLEILSEAQEDIKKAEKMLVM